MLVKFNKLLFHLDAGIPADIQALRPHTQSAVCLYLSLASQRGVINRQVRVLTVAGKWCMGNVDGRYAGLS